MALPPEPLEELLLQATLIIEAKVLKIIAEDERPPSPVAPVGATSVGSKAPQQLVQLGVERVFKGAVKAGASTVKVTKPEAGYALTRGNRGVFFLVQEKSSTLIIGRYGPDTYPVTMIEAALASN